MPESITLRAPQRAPVGARARARAARACSDREAAAAPRRRARARRGRLAARRACGRAGRRGTRRHLRGPHGLRPGGCPDAGWWRELVGSRAPARHRPLRRARHRLARRSGASSAPLPGQADFPRGRCARPGRGARSPSATQLGIARLHAVAGASYGGMVGLALAEMRAAARRRRARDQRRAPQPRARDRLAQHPARDRPPRPRARRRCRRARARARARDDDLPHARRASSAAFPAPIGGGAVRGASQSSSTCWRARRGPTRGDTGPRASCACPSRSTGTASTRRASACRCTWWRSPRTSW